MQPFPIPMIGPLVAEIFMFEIVDTMTYVPTVRRTPEHGYPISSEGSGELTKQCFHESCPKDADGMANRVDPDQIAPLGPV